MTPPSGSPTFPTLAVVSGKGGTGKTTVAVNLALTAPFPVGLLDCDVEEPNSRLTLHPVMAKTRSVTRPLPEVLVDRCVACGDCIRACRFNAIAPTATVPYIVPKLCEVAGSAYALAHTGAIVENPQEVGMIEEGASGDIYFAEGLLHLGHTPRPTVIQALRQGPLGIEP
jgi:MinD superfamily P-loop ATPase